MNSKDTVIHLHHVSKKYSLRHEKPTLMENVLNRGINQEFWALKRLDFKIHKGETVGIIGKNGSGKTTLLKIIAGITNPTQGRVNVEGHLVSLIDLEAGFHSDLTGEENIYLNALLLGADRRTVKDKINTIIDFADIGKFIDAPLYTYSSGMKLRLGFSIAIHTNPEVLILDENLAVGDENFKEKTAKKIRELMNKNITMILASHDLSMISKMCQRVIYLDKGLLVADGKTTTVINKYIKNFN